MTNLEFINDRIRTYETMLLTAIDTKCSKKQIKYYEEQLNMFKQIKIELEAWEEIKKYIVLMEEQYPLYDTTYEYIELENGCIDESNTNEEGKSIMIIKKALKDTINHEPEE